VASRAWDFGDGATSTQRNPSRTYAAPGEYRVTLRVTDDEGAGDARTRTAAPTTAAPEPNGAPRAEFQVTCRDLRCTFVDRSEDQDGRVASWAWDFGDGATSSQRNPAHSYGAAGRYTVSLRVTDDDGATSSRSHTATATAPAPAPNEPPRAGFSLSCQELTCRFTDQSSDADGSIASRLWDFGDGATSTERNPSHTYAAGGSYTVTLRVTDDDGATDTRSQPASPTAPAPEPNEPPHADFRVKCHRLACAFEDKSKDEDGSVVSWQWSFGDGATSTEQNPEHEYADRGHYDVQLTVTDDDGATASTTHHVDPKR